ncbi:MAG: hydantoinase/oxoprolinase family protein, partial [Pseudomonadota bacterium]
EFVEQGLRKGRTTTSLTAFMRYAGQGWEIPVHLPYRAFSGSDVPAILAAFAEAYRTLFGRTIDGLAPEITNWSLIVASVLPEAETVCRREGRTAAGAMRTRTVFDAALRRNVEAQEVERQSMRTGATVDGPAVIVEAETSTIVTSAYRAIGQPDGCLLLIRKEAN